MHESKHSTPHALRTRPFVVGATLLVLLGLLEGLFLSRNTTGSPGLFYGSDVLALLACAVAFVLHGRSTTSSFRLRWILLAGGVVCAAIGYLIACVQTLLSPEIPAARAAQIFCFTASEALYLLAVVLFFSNVRWSVVLVDMLQALLFVVLRFNLSYNYATRDYLPGHLQIGLLVALFLFVIAVVGCVGAVSRAELKFLRTLSWFFGVRYVGFFLSNQVSYLWLGYLNSSALDAVGSTLLAVFGLHQFLTDRKASTAVSGQLRSRSIMVRNLMPSFLAIVNVMLGLFTLEHYKPFASVALGLTVIFYVVRTNLLQNQASEEQAVLQSRNEHLEGLTTLDPLTGIGNRRSLTEACERLLTSDRSEPLALLLMDIDHFKEANDRHGHLHGDAVLIALGKTLQGIADQSPDGHCARFGGDEFALLLPGVSPWRASALAEELRTAFAAHRFEATDQGSTLSVGLAIASGEERISLDSLIALADAALYRAKLQGRNRVAAA